ncbi:hypothetical protein LINPERPRIM_LOCUS25158 [Linum perenne]
MDSTIFVNQTTVRRGSFSSQDYSYRRVFLRIYPLHWEEDDDNSYQDMTRSTEKHNQKKIVKKELLMSRFNALFWE